MDHKTVCLAVAPSLGAIAVGYWLTTAPPSSSLAHGLAIAFFCVSLIWPLLVWLVLSRDDLTIEEWPVNNALNFRITNKRIKAGIVEDVLILHSVKLWNAGRRQFQSAELRATNAPVKLLPLRLTNDQPGLPYRTPRMFQLLQFTDWSAPFIQGYIVNDNDMTLAHVPLPCRGFWQFDMELRWAGGGRQITRVFEWGDCSLPRFCKPPS